MLVCAVGLMAIAAVVRAPFFGQGIEASDTTGYYLPVGHGLLHGQGFPNSFRPPGFPILIATVEGFGIDPVTGIVVVQNLIGIVMPALVLLIGWRFFSPRVGALAGFLTAASPLMFVTEQVALPDFLFGIVTLAGAVLLAEAALRLAARRLSWKLCLATGVVFGLATLLRPNGQVAVLAIPIVLLVAARNWRVGLRFSAIAVGAMVVVLFPWILHNLIRFGDPQVATEGGVSLYGRVITSERRPPPAHTPEGRLALSVYNTGGPTVAVLNALTMEGRSINEAAAAMGVLAREAIVEDPGVYLADTAHILGQYVSAYDPNLVGTNSSGDQIGIIRQQTTGAEGLETVPGDALLTRVPWEAAQVVNGVLFVLTLGGLLVLLLPFVGRTSSRLASTTFLLTVVLGLVPTALVVRFELRFGTLYAPLAWLLFAAAGVLIVEFLFATLRRRSWRPRRGSLGART